MHMFNVVMAQVLGNNNACNKFAVQIFPRSQKL